jgi:hypothetical protein
VTTHGPKDRVGLRLPPVKNTPTISATKSDNPMPMGARKVALCFSAASMKIVKTSRDVRNISRNTPMAGVTPLPRVVETLRGPGRIAETTPAAAMPASIWEMKQRRARRGVRAWMRRRPRVTCFEVLGCGCEEVRLGLMGVCDVMEDLQLD